MFTEEPPNPQCGKEYFIFKNFIIAIYATILSDSIDGIQTLLLLAIQFEFGWIML